MSSGLTIQKSHIIDSWEGRRLWLNLKSLGLEKFYDNKASRDRQKERSTNTAPEQHYDDDDDDDDSIEHNLENLWIKHISLSPRDLKSDPPGIQVRPMEGLAGVDYLTPGTLTSFLSYVFGPVINALQKQGYEDGVNLDAAPYDWRLSPIELERRDEYFSNTMKKVEEMHKRNGLPIVLLCHSLGCKVAQYFLEFANAKDKTWCERYIHTYMPVGAPHLGAPVALRGVLSSDKMGLEAFLTDSEALAMCRTLSSIPWLIPSHVPPSSVPSMVRREGAFEININSTINIVPLLEGRVECDIPQKLELVVRYGKRTLTTRFVPLVDNEVHFKGKFIFSTGPEGPYAKQCCAKCCQCCILKCACCACCSDNHLIISICEPGLNETRRTKKGAEMRQKCCSVDSRRKWLKIIFCWWIIKWAFIVAGYLTYLVSYKLWLRVADAISRFSGGSSQLAVCAPVDLRGFVGETASHNVEVELRNDLKQAMCRRKEASTPMPSINVNVRWVPPPDVSTIPTGSKLLELSDDRYQLIDGLACKQDGQNWEYEAIAGSRILEEEVGHDDSISKAVSEMYDADPLQPRGSLKPPPVKHIKAVYGVNLPTEVGAVYKRKRTYAERKHKVKSKYELDERAKYRSGNHGYILDDGIFYETKDTPQMIEAEGRVVSCSGDGSVPYWSLQHVRNWKTHCSVEITELDGARHREILADRRFHEVLIDYVTTEADACV
ncbi:hypothetical protein ACHAXR_004337 [Thalassiosira sp. AJA248-18]